MAQRFLPLPWVLLVGLFGFLPWSEVSCNSKDLSFRVTQSGYQALYGGVSSPVALEELAKNRKERASNDYRTGAKLVSFEESDYLISFSPFLACFWAGVLATTLIICLMPLSSLRLKFVLTIVTIMLAMLAIQCALDTPLERRANRATAEMVQEDSSQALIALAAISTGKTAWFWLTVTAVALAGVSEVVVSLLWTRGPDQVRVAIPCAAAGLLAALSLGGVITQFALREARLDAMKNRITQLQKIEEGIAEKAEAEKQEEERERQRQAEERRERERRREFALGQEQKALELERERQRLEAERQEKARAEREAQETERQKQLAVEKRHLVVQLEQERKEDLERRGLAYYPKPTSQVDGRNAEEWYQLATSNPGNANIQRQASSALVALKDEGMPFLLDSLQKQVTPAGRDTILRLIAPAYVHRNDLREIVACLDKKRCLNSTRLLALRYLRQRTEASADIQRIVILVADLANNAHYKTEVRDLLDAIKCSKLR